MDIIKTRRNIYLILEQTPFFYIYDNYKFYFSSKFNLERFQKGIKNYVITESYYINKRYDEILEPIFFYRSYYKKIEKRGFLIKEINNKG